MIDVLLYGGGTQSTGLLLMLCDGHLKGYTKPDIVIFADTKSEPHFVDDYILKVSEYVKRTYDVELITVSAGSLKADIKNNSNTGERVASLPLFMSNGGMINRQCTFDYKINPVNKYLKKTIEIGRKKKGSEPVVNRMFGYSLDEIERCKVSSDWWAVNDHPLVMNRLYRHEVINYINKNHPELKNPPRSACYFCPFHSDVYWRELKKKYPDVFKEACKIDEMIRIKDNLKYECYVHRSLKPLSEIDFSTTQLEIFGECEGYCGV
jgi:hypothetical protein